MQYNEFHHNKYTVINIAGILRCTTCIYVHGKDVYIYNLLILFNQIDYPPLISLKTLWLYNTIIDLCS